MAASCTLRVVGVDGPSVYRGYGVLHKTRLVQRIGVDGHLHPELLGHSQTGVNRSRCGAPILMELETTGTRLDLLGQDVQPVVNTRL